MPSIQPAALLGAALLFAACACDAAHQDKEQNAVPDQPPSYAGPELTATIEATDGQPPRYELLVDVHCPTGGYTLTAQGVDEKDGVRRARFLLTAPARDELVTQAFEHKLARVPLGEARTPVQVLVAEHQRNEPVTAAYALAATVAPR